jgi:hypothetical protein
MKKLSANAVRFSLLVIIIVACGGGGGGDNGGGSPPKTNGGSYETQIGTNGGTLEITDRSNSLYGFKLDIPAGALSNDVLLSVSVPPVLPEVPADFQRKSSLVVKLGPSPLSFKKPVLVTIPYNDAEVDENKLVVLVFNEQSGEWEAARIFNIDKLKNQVTLEMDHFSIVEIVSNFDLLFTVVKAGITLPSLIVKSLETDESGTYAVTNDGRRLAITDSGINIDGEIHCVVKVEPAPTGLDVILKVVKLVGDPAGLLKNEIINAIQVMSAGVEQYIKNCAIGEPSCGTSGTHDWTTLNREVDVNFETGTVSMSFDTKVGYDKWNLFNDNYFVIENRNLNSDLYKNTSFYRLDIEVRVGSHLVFSFKNLEKDFVRKIIKINKAVLNRQTFSQDLVQINVSARQFFTGRVVGTGTQIPAIANSCSDTPVSRPPTPTEFSVTPISSSQIDLFWNASTGAAGYKIYKDGARTPLKSITTTSTSDTGLSSSTNYCYSVTAYNSAGESDPTSQRCATTASEMSTNIGIWQRNDAGEESKGKEYLANNQGYLGNFTSGSFQRATPFTWSLSENVITEVWAATSTTPSETHHETVSELTDSSMTQYRQEDGITRHWARGCSAVVGNWAGTLTGNNVCGNPYTGTWTMTVNSNCSATIWAIYSSGNPGGGSSTVVGNSSSASYTCTGCTGTSGSGNFSGLFSGNNFTGNNTGCGEVNNFTGTRQ